MPTGRGVVEKDQGVVRAFLQPTKARHWRRHGHGLEIYTPLSGSTASVHVCCLPANTGSKQCATSSLAEVGAETRFGFAAPVVAHMSVKVFYHGHNHKDQFSFSAMAGVGAEVPEGRAPQGDVKVQLAGRLVAVVTTRRKSWKHLAGSTNKRQQNHNTAPEEV